MKTIHPGHLEHRFCIFGCQILCITDLAIMPPLSSPLSWLQEIAQLDYHLLYFKIPRTEKYIIAMCHLFPCGKELPTWRERNTRYWMTMTESKLLWTSWKDDSIKSFSVVIRNWKVEFSEDHASSSQTWANVLDDEGRSKGEDQLVSQLEEPFQKKTLM